MITEKNRNCGNIRLSFEKPKILEFQKYVQTALHCFLTGHCPHCEKELEFFVGNNDEWRFQCHACSFEAEGTGDALLQMLKLVYSEEELRIIYEELKNDSQFPL